MNTFVSELISFPSCPTSDQVDAMTLYLDYDATHDIPPRRERALGILVNELRPLPQLLTRRERALGILVSELRPLPQSFTRRAGQRGRIAPW